MTYSQLKLRQQKEPTSKLNNHLVKYDTYTCTINL